MPIRPEWRHHYIGPEWKETRERILDRAGGACERCGKPGGQKVYTYTWQSWRLAEGEPLRRAEKVYHMVWTPENGNYWRNEEGERLKVCEWPCGGLPRLLLVVLTVAHLDHNPANQSDDNLAALCQWCHLRHDLRQHAESRAGRRDRARPLLTTGGSFDERVQDCR